MKSKRTIYPNLFIIGAQKAGTSSLHEYLNQHPEIHMSSIKEPQYFAPHKTIKGIKWGLGQDYPKDGLNWYLKLFDGAKNFAYAGESSTSYTARPLHEGCANNIYSFNPNARIIYLLRDPIDRAISHYWHRVKSGREDKTIIKAFMKNCEYLSRSHYSYQLKPYIELFGHKNIFVFTIEEFMQDHNSLLKELFKWLKISHNITVDVSQKYNVGQYSMQQTRRGFLILDKIKKHWRWNLYSKHIPTLCNKYIDKFIYKRVYRNNDEIYAVKPFIQPTLIKYTEELKFILDREFNEWKNLYS